MGWYCLRKGAWGSNGDFSCATFPCMRSMRDRERLIHSYIRVTPLYVHRELDYHPPRPPSTPPRSKRPDDRVELHQQRLLERQHYPVQTRATLGPAEAREVERDEHLPVVPLGCGGGGEVSAEVRRRERSRERAGERLA